MTFAQVFGNKPLSGYPLIVGGVACTALVTAVALDRLLAAPGTVIRPVLARLESPLVACDYQLVAAPYRARFLGGPVTGRGGAGRPVTKQAFCLALSELLACASNWAPVKAYALVTATAWAAFGSDFGYSEAMARAACVVAVASESRVGSHDQARVLESVPARTRLAEPVLAVSAA